MQVTDTFKNIISNHLQGVAEKDSLFAETLKKANKNINDCITYIINTVKQSGKIGFADEEIFGMAVHYYDEDDIKVGSPVSCQVVVNHRADAPKNPTSGSTTAERNKTARKAKIESADTQISLF